MNRALTAAAVVIMLFTGGCGDDENEPQKPTTGDTLERPSTTFDPPMNPNP